MKKIFNGLKGLFRRKKADDSDYDEYEERYHSEDDAEYLSNEDYEDYDEEEDEEFEARELTLKDINPEEMAKRQQKASQPPEKIEYADEEFEEVTNPNYDEFEVSQLSQKGRLAQAIARFRKKLGASGATASLSRVKKKNRFFETLKNFDYDAVFQALFSPESRKSIHRAFLFGLLGTSTYLGGRMLADALKPPLAQKGTSLSAPMAGIDYGTQMSTIADVDLFAALGEKPRPAIGEPQPTIAPSDEPLVCEEADRSSNLPIKLSHTIVLQDSVKSLASVQVRGGKDVQFVREGDNIEGLAEVGKIDNLKMIFKNLRTRQCEYIENRDRSLDQLKKTRPFKTLGKEEGRKAMKAIEDKDIISEGNSFKIKKDVRDQMLANISEVLTQARAIQIKNPDGSLAFKMTEIVPGSIYSKLNIQDGDIISGINGKKIQNLNEIMTLFGKIRDIDQFELTVKRNGMEQNLEYNFE